MVLFACFLRFGGQFALRLIAFFVGLPVPGSFFLR